MSSSLTLYHRQGCHLCEQMLAELQGLYAADVAVVTVDVDSNPELRVRYGLEVPVLAAGSEILCRGRLDREKLEEYLDRG